MRDIQNWKEDICNQGTFPEKKTITFVTSFMERDPFKTRQKQFYIHAVTIYLQQFCMYTKLFLRMFKMF